MEGLMLLGGQFLQARIRDEYRGDQIMAATRERAYWDSVSEGCCGMRAGHSFVARLLAAVIVLSVLLTGLALAESLADPSTGALASR